MTHNHHDQSSKSGEHRSSERDQLLILMTDRATVGLDTEEERELESLLMKFPDEPQDSMDRAAAAIGALLEDIEPEPMPASLKSRLQTDAIAWLASERGLKLAADDQPEAPSPAPVELKRQSEPSVRAASAINRGVPWVAAAAGILLAVIAWMPRLSTPPGDGGDPVAPSLAQLRQELIDTTDDVLLASWSAAPDGVTGDVVWSNARQEGYVRLAGLEANDPRVSQYQLWIFDEARKSYNEANIRVDGGVFDIESAAGETIIPIKAKLQIFEPTTFAVTVEPPGGVIESNLQNVVLLSESVT